MHPIERYALKIQRVFLIQFIPMTNTTFLRFLFLFFSMLLNAPMVYGQEVPILNYSTNSNGQVQLEVNSTDQHYYILNIRHNIDSVFQLPTSMTLGEAGTTVITESVASYPLAHYQVLEYSIATPVDTDGDSIDDISEYQNMPDQSPLNAAFSIEVENGLVMIDSFSTFEELSVKKDVVQWSEFLNGKEFAKYIIVDFFTKPKIFFINSNNHDLHEDFANEVGIDYLGDHVKKGQIMYHPTIASNNGTDGVFAFNYSNGHPQDFDIVQTTFELLSSNMPFLENNLSYFITDLNKDQYEEDKDFFEDSRVPILLETDVYEDVDYWPLNRAEGFGFFRKMALEELPGQKDIVLYETLPNSLPRVGGIMTSVIQTPLSHVNLRAIQDGLPNAFIRDPLAIDSIADLLDHYIYYKVESDAYFIREATLEEVNDWYEDLRPENVQIPPLNLNYKDILPLDDITFTMSDGFGAKCANIATMQNFDFPDGTIPDGFGVPFYFYQEFMAYNDFMDEAKDMIKDPDFVSERVIRNEELKKFRKKIKAADMPNWMLNELADMHASFPAGTSVRCRSSSNNEDLAGFNGAGLYDSKTQHPDEGHISKSIKQVFASLWNLRAYEEREFYRIDHFVASMGVLCHPNYNNEKANGVGVSVDPLYGTDSTFYLNTQVGEELITNPETNSRPEEILLDRELGIGAGYIVIQHSNLVTSDSTILSEQHLAQMRDYLSVIHQEFETLYDAVDNETFSMDIEYKITSENQLIIKQARPWVSYVVPFDSVITVGDPLALKLYPNPAHDFITAHCEECELSKVSISNILGQVVLVQDLSDSENSNSTISIENLPSGLYILNGFKGNEKLTHSKKFVKGD